MKNYNLTEKLDFDGNPTITIKDETIEVKADAMNVLEVLASAEKSDAEFVKTGFELLFSEEDKEKIKSFKFKTKDFVKVIRTAFSLAMGNNPEEKGEM